MPKLIAAKDRFDVHFARDYQPPEISDWLDTENLLPSPLQPYFLRSNTGPKWMLGGVMSRPFINASQSGGKFAISSIESSGVFGKSPLAQWLTFPTVDHCFYVAEGLLRVKVGDDDDQWNSVREGQTVVISAGQAFMLEFQSRYVRVISFTNGCGIEQLIQTAGSVCSGCVLPEEPSQWDDVSIQIACKELGVKMSTRI
jgi:hypothetical protein